MEGGAGGDGCGCVCVDVVCGCVWMCGDGCGWVWVCVKTWRRSGKGVAGRGRMKVRRVVISWVVLFAVQNNLGRGYRGCREEERL